MEKKLIRQAVNRIVPFNQWALKQVSRGLLMVVCLCALGVQGHAQFATDQDKPARDLTQISLEDLMQIEVKNVVGASKYSQKVTEAPASVSIVTADEIQRYGYRTLADILRSIRGMYTSYDRNYSYVGARGFARPGDYNTRVLLLIDGHRLNDNVYDQAPIGREFPIDVDLIERLEIIRGPSSSLYGTNAFFAVINVITKRGPNLNGLQAATDVASFDSYSGRVTFGKKYSNGFDLLVSGSLFDSQGQRHLYYQAYDDPATNHGIAERADAEDFKHLFANFSWRGFTLQSVYSTRKKVVPTGAFGTVFNDPRNNNVDAHGYLDLRYERDLSKQTRLTARVYGDRYDYHGDYPYTAIVDDKPLVEIGKDSAAGTWWGGEVNLIREIGKKHKLTLGAEYRDNLRQDQKYYDTPDLGANFESQTDSKIWAIFGQDEMRIHPKLFFNFGARYDHYGTFGGTFNPRLGLVYNPFKQTAIKLLYGQAFRAPNAYELYYYPIPTNTGQPPLQPERIQTGELVWEQYLGKRWRVAVSAFNNRLKNLISQITDEANDANAFKNVEKISSRGVELELEAKLSRRFEGTLSYGLQKTKIEETGESLSNSPRHLLKLNLSSALIGDKLIGSGEFQFMSNRKTILDNQTGKVLLTNLTVLSRKLCGGLDLSFSVYNLFNRKYGDPGAEEHLQDVITQDGRTYRLKLTYTFDGHR